MMQQDKIELIAVFRKNVDEKDAHKILDETGVAYRKGMDSSRGKIYFYSTGPKFILTFATQQEKEGFLSKYGKKPVFHEIYVPDWTVTKD